MLRITSCIFLLFLSFAMPIGNVQASTVDPATIQKVAPGTYPNIITGSGIEHVYFDSGTTTIQGAPDAQLISPLPFDLANPSIQIGSDSSGATLILENGTLTGDIKVGANRNYLTSLIIGSLNSRGTVQITGAIGGSMPISGTSPDNSVLRTNGSSLIVTGSIGSSRLGRLSTVEAALGNITIQPDGTTSSRAGDLNSLSAIARANQIITASGIVQVQNLFLYPHSSLVTQRGRVDVHAIIDGGTNGLLDTGSSIQAPRDSIWLWQGASQASGTIVAAKSIGTHQGLHYSPPKEEMVHDLDQGTGSLTIEAGENISVGNMNVTSVTVGHHLVAGTEFSETNTSTTDRIYTADTGISGYFAPRGTINTQELNANDAGAVFAGQINVEGGSPSTVQAGNVVVVKETERDGLPPSTGDFSITGKSFKFTAGDLGLAGDVNIPWGARIDNNFTVTGNRQSSFTTMTVGGAVPITEEGGTAHITEGVVSGNRLLANSALFENLSLLDLQSTSGSPDVAPALETKKEFTISGTQQTNINIASAGTDATIDGGSYIGESLIASNNVTFSGSKLVLGKQLEATNNNVSITGADTVKVPTLHAGQDFLLRSSSYEGSDISVGGNATLAAGMTVTGTATIGGSLETSGANNMQFNTLKTGATVTITDSHLIANQIETGTQTASNGGLTVQGGSFELGSGDQSAGKVHGNLVLQDADSSSFTDLTVDGALEMSGGYLDGTSMKAANAVLKNYSLAHIDSLNLAGATSPLEIEEGSVLVVDSIVNPSGADITGSGLIITGDLETRSELGDLDVKSSVLDAEKAILETGSITGTGKGSETDDVKVFSLNAQNIEVDDANFILTGLGGYKSTVAEDLVITRNGNSRLADISVTGSTSISGGSVQARQFSSGGPATFDGVQLTLSGKNSTASTFGQDLTITNNTSSSLGDLKVSGEFSAEGGAIVAGVLNTKKTARFTGVELKLNGIDGSPGRIGENLILEQTPLASLGVLNVDGNLNGNGGEVRATQIAVQHDVNMSGVTLTLAGTEQKPDTIGGDLLLQKNPSVKIGSLEVSGATSIDGGEANADRLSTGSADFSGVKSKLTSLVSTGETNFAQGVTDIVNLDSGGANFTNGVNASIINLNLSDPTGFLNVASPQDSVGRTQVVVSNLNLGGGQLQVGNTQVEPATLFIQGFVDSQQAPGSINGLIGVGTNGHLILGTIDPHWLPDSLTHSSAILGLATSMRVGSNQGLHVTGSGAAAPSPGTIRFDSGSLLVIDGSSKKNYYTGEWIRSALLNSQTGAPGALSADSTTRATVGAGAQIYIRNPVPDTVIVALGENIETSFADSPARASDQNGWTDANLQYDNQDSLIITRLDGPYSGQFSVSVKETPPDQPTTPGGDKPAPPDQPTNPGGADPVIPSHPDRPGSLQPDRDKVPGSHIPGIIPQLPTAASDAATAAVSRRMGLWADDGIRAKSTALWAVPMFRSRTAWGLEAGTQDLDFFGDVGGIALGGDATLADKLRLGVAFHIGAGYAKRSGGEFTTTGNLDFWGAGVYASWIDANWSISGDANYTSTYGKYKQDASPDLPQARADIQASVVSAGMKLEYMIETGLAEITPHAGFRFHYLHAYDYDIDAYGTYTAMGSGFDQNFWTFPMGVTVAKNLPLQNDWLLKPRFALHVTPAAGDIYVSTPVEYMNREYDYHTQTRDYITFGASAGLEFKAGNFSAGVDYSLDAGVHTFSNTLTGLIRYEF